MGWGTLSRFVTRLQSPLLILAHGSLDSLGVVNGSQDQGTCQEEDNDRNDAQPARTGDLPYHPKEEWPNNACEFAAHIIEAKEFRRH